MDVGLVLLIIKAIQKKSFANISVRQLEFNFDKVWNNNLKTLWYSDSVGIPFLLDLKFLRMFTSTIYIYHIFTVSPFCFYKKF